ncbi:hypothetical protein [Actinotalea sp. Marseille-Q4924]|uniref:hypothetical protein n=1 Tax=Actinotalea sp. Marseille-Q4924 TaxID=2866571 RepID=UPI001CE401CC|nr:hypothetical protein [Actinotalea sp. Marseille-Q4924]
MGRTRDGGGPARLVRSEDLHDAAAAVHADVARWLGARRVPGSVHLTGALSVPGVLTRGDVDLHLRVPPDVWEEALPALRDLLPVVHPEIWCATLATFAVPPGLSGGLPAGLAATPVGSEHDVRFTRTWQRLAAEPDAVAELNALKAASWAVSPQEYEAQKGAFFERLLRG